MVPARIEARQGPLPRNANGKIDRKAIAELLRATSESSTG
jgi:acyl-CoA synthetase (AMP-forming)/AMP-acid ligase II